MSLLKKLLQKLFNSKEEAVPIIEKRDLVDDYYGEVLAATKEQKLSSDNVSHYYDTWTERYLEGFGDTFQSQRTDKLDELFAYIIEQAEIKDGQRILDAGCGVAGPATRIAQQKKVQIEGITISEVQHKIAQKNIKEKGFEKQINVTKGDYHFLDKYYEPNSFDAIIFLESLVHSDHPHLVLESAFKVLKPNGVLYVKDLFRYVSPDKEENEHVKRVIRNVNKYFALRIKPKKWFIDLMEEKGFEFLWEKEITIDTNHNIGNTFVADNNLDIYEGRVVTFLEWLEMKARKKQAK